MDVRFLDLAEVLEAHVDQIERYGGAAGLRDRSLLLSALAMPMAGAGGVFVHVTLFDMAAAHPFHVAKNHPFVDGNKRTALACALTFLDLNDVTIHAETDELVALVEGVVLGRVEKSEAALWFRDHAGR